MKSIRKYKKCTLLGFTALQLVTAILSFQVMSQYNLGMGKDLLSFVINSLFYLIIFVMPFFLYLRFYDRVNPVVFLKLDRNTIKGVYKGVIIGSFIFLTILVKNRFLISKDFNFMEDTFLILGRLIVGFFEEIPFRGFYLQKFKEYMGFWKANLLSASLFTVLHIPGRVYLGTGSINSFFIIFVIGLWMGYIFRETKSLWCVVLAHSIYNISLYIIY